MAYLLKVNPNITVAYSAFIHLFEAILYSPCSSEMSITHWQSSHDQGRMGQRLHWRLEEVGDTRSTSDT